MTTPLVVKLGGSLLDAPELRAILAACGDAARHGAAVAIVPGGGPFADAVRTAQAGLAFDDSAAHDMALLAMAQFGRALAALANLRVAWSAGDVAADLAAGRSPVVWLPDPRRDALEVERSWRITSDSLALWLANRIGARRLLLVKRCAVPEAADLAAWTAEGVVDAAFAETAARYAPIETHTIAAADVGRLKDLLSSV